MGYSNPFVCFFRVESRRDNYRTTTQKEFEVSDGYDFSHLDPWATAPSKLNLCRCHLTGVAIRQSSVAE